MHSRKERPQPRIEPHSDVIDLAVDFVHRLEQFLVASVGRDSADPEIAAWRSCQPRRTARLSSGRSITEASRSIAPSLDQAVHSWQRKSSVVAITSLGAIVFPTR